MHASGLPSAAARGLYLLARAIDLGIRGEVRTLPRQIVGRPAKRFDLPRRDEARNQRPTIAVEPFADRRTKRVESLLGLTPLLQIQSASQRRRRRARRGQGE